MINRKKGLYLCLPALALGVSVWAAPHWQDKDSSHKEKPPTAKMSAANTIPALPAAQSIQNRLNRTRAKATAAGKVSCCIRPACDFCISHLAMCQCRTNLTNNKPVCRECKGGWAAGDGAMDHMEAANVPVMKTPQVIKDINDAKATSKSGKDVGAKTTLKRM